MGGKKIGQRCLHCLHNNWLSLAMLGAIIIGAGIGLGLKGVKKWTNREVMCIGFLGEIFLFLLKGVCIPLISTSIIIAFSSLDSRLVKIFGLQLVTYMFATKLIVLFVALIIVMFVKIEKRGSAYAETPPLTIKKEIVDNFLDLIRNIFPDNIFKSFIMQTTTNITKDKDETVYEVLDLAGTNMFGIVCFSIFVGIALKTIGIKNNPFLDVVKVIESITFVIVKLIMYIGPLLLMSLIAQKTLQMDIHDFVSALGVFTLLMGAAAFVFFLFGYPLLLCLLARTNPFKFYLGILDAITTSLATSSSMASLPIVMECLSSKLGYDEALVSFLVPICINLNKDGSLMNIVIVTVFFAHYTNTSLSLINYFLLCIFAITMSLAIPGVPNGLVIVLIMVFEPFGIPTSVIGEILAVDIVVDRFATMINVVGTAVCVPVIDNWSKKKRALLTKEMEIPTQDISQENVLPSVEDEN